MIKNIFTTAVFIVLTLKLFSSNNEKVNIKRNNLNLPFIENVGQFNTQVKFYVNTFYGTTSILRNGEIAYSILKKEGNQFFTERIVNGRISEINGHNACESKINYFNGENPELWKQGINSYGSVIMTEIYSGINLELKAYANNTEKLFIVKPEANPNEIEIEIQGIDELKINKDGELVLSSSRGNTSFTTPIAYQETDGVKKYVDVEYSVSGKTYGFNIGNYDSNNKLIIDPLISSTYIGGSNLDDNYEPSMIMDSLGNIYVTGYTSSFDFPSTSGSFDETFGGSSDRFVSKFSNDLSTLIASTFIGGSGIELGHGICMDDDGNIYLGGYTASSDFPTTTGAYDETFNAMQDAYVLKLNNDLSELLASTYYGGTKAEGQAFERFDMTIGKNGNIYITGITPSTDLPMLANSYKSTNSGFFDLFVAEFNPELTELLGATYLGSPDYDWRPGVLVDSEGNVFIGGDAMSGYPTTAGAYSENYLGGGYDVVVSKLSDDLSTLLASTYIGSSGEEDLIGMRFNKNDELIFTGFTNRSTYPTTSDAFDRTYNGGDADMFITKISNDLTSVIASTLVGGNQFDVGHDIVLDSLENIYLVGHTKSTNFPTTEYVFDKTHNGGEDAYILRMSKDLSTLEASSFIGGNGDDRVQSLVLDSLSNVYIAGRTTSNNFPTISGSYDPYYNGGTNDCFVSKLDSILKGDEHTFIEEINSESLIQIYPNPTSGMICVKLLESSENSVIKVISNNGVIVDEISGDNILSNTEIYYDCSKLVKGMYYIQYLNNNTLINKKLVVN